MPDSIRRQVLVRDGWQCQAHNYEYALHVRCSGPLHVHHRRLKGMGGTSRTDVHDPDFLLTLCARHHTYAHDVDRAGANAAGVIVRRGG